MILNSFRLFQSRLRVCWSHKITINRGYSLITNNNNDNNNNNNNNDNRSKKMTSMVQDSLIVYEDNKVIVMNKPCNILVQGDQSNTITLLDHAKAFVKEKYNKKGKVFLGLVHRLDRVTSGLIVFARNSKSAGRLSDSFRRNAVTKRYVCVVHSMVPLDAGTCINWLSQDASERIDVFPEDYVGPKANQLKRAVLHYQLLDRIPIVNSESSELSGVGTTKEGLSLLLVTLETGRKHQIRAQLSAMGYPIVGDSRYYSSQLQLTSAGSIFKGLNTIALHSFELTFPHPGSGDMMSFLVPPPKEAWCKLLGNERYDKHFNVPN